MIDIIVIILKDIELVNEEEDVILEEDVLDLVGLLVKVPEPVPEPPVSDPSSESESDVSDDEAVKDMYDSESIGGN